MLEFTGERFVPDAANVSKAGVNRLRQEHIVRYLLAGMVVGGREVLDFGSGEGYGVAMLARAGARLAHGIEISAAAVEHARATYGTAGVEYFVGDVRTTKLDHVYDVVTCFEMIEHVDDQPAVIRNAKAHLRDGGFLIISTPRPSDVYENEFHVKEITGDELLQLVKAEFAQARVCLQSNFTVSLAGEGTLNLAGGAEVVEIAGNVGFDTADFVIVIASDDASALAALQLRPVATVNDESYLHQVERDNRILFTAERNLQSDVAVLRRAESNLQRDVEILRTAEATLQRDVKILQTVESNLRDENEVLRASEANLKNEVAELRTSVWRSKEIAEHSERVSEALRGELDAQLIAGERSDLRRWWPLFLHPIERRSLSRVAMLRARRVLVAISRGGDPLSRLTFLNGCPEGESKRYRIENIAAAARLCGVHVTMLELTDCLRHFQSAPTDLLVLFRTRFTPEIGQLIANAKERRIPTVFDVDDLVFEPESVDFIGAVQGLAEEQKDFHRREVAAFRQTLEMCDFATATTAFLGGRIEALGIPTQIVPNTINRKQLAVAELEKAAAAKGAGVAVRIGYFSGSPTHNKDFLEAAGALARVLREFPSAVFHIVGSVDLDERFREFEARIRRYPFMPYLDMLRFMRAMDLVIAPLELDNPFTAGKSELKIFEAALVRVPCVASAVDSYRASIENGKDGFLCARESEWYDALATLVRDQARRSAVGDAAYRRFVPRFYIGNRIGEILGTYHDCLRRYRQRMAGSAAPR